MASVAVVGATTWGTTLALILAQRGLPVCLWTRTEPEERQLRSKGESPRLPGIAFPPSLKVTSSLQTALGDSTLVVMAVPSSSLRANARIVGSAIKQGAIVVSATKGLERDTGKRMSQVLQEELPHHLSRRICVLSGPNLALEIAQGKPASSVIACRNEAVAVEAQEIFMSATFRVYTNTDVLGVELAGALKNIIALGAGICDGLGYGNNAKAAFITRGLVEITRVGVAAGANPLTFAGLAGLGDLVATCASPLSRNRYVGEQLAKGRDLKDVLSSMKNVAEGVDTTAAALKMASQLGVEMPITQATHRILFEGLALHQAVVELMGRAPRSEWSGVPGQNQL